MANEFLGAKHLSNQSVGELQRVNNFFVEISGLPKNVCFLIKGFPLPASSNEVLTIKYGNSVIKLPGAVSFEGGDMTIYDSIDLDTEKALADWRASVYNPQSEALGQAVNFKKDATVTQYTPDGTVGRQWKLEGVWPSDFKPGEMNNDSSDVKSMSIHLEWDRAYRL